MRKLADDTGNRLTIVYDGALAGNGEMFFYEFSRAAYGASRLITTIEFFRRTGRVAKRISSQNYIPLVIKAPEKGSFPIDILIPVALEAAKMVKEYDIPVGEFIKYIVHLLKRTLPKDEETIIELAKIDLKREEQRTAQSEEETERISEIRKIVESGNANTLAAIGVLERSIKSSDTRIPELGVSNTELRRILSELLEQHHRQVDLEKYEDRLQGIDEEKLLKLATKVRPQLAELGLPLRHERSAASVTFKIDGSSFAKFNEEGIQDINSRSLDGADAVTTLRIFAYDKDSGYGKCDLLDFEMSRISFAVPVNIRTRLKPFVIAAMNEDAVTATVRFFRDKSRSITSVLLYKLDVALTFTA